MTSFPAWLQILAVASLAAGVACAIIVALDLLRRPQRMGVMNAVWPLTMLFGGPAWLAFYYRWGRSRPGERGGETPMAVAVATGTSHCGAGCALGDLIVEWAAFALPAVAVAFGYGTWFGERMVAVWIPDYLVAFAIGIVFQYFAIAPMRGLGLAAGLKAAVKADAASITAWQVGMYGAMALLQLAWLRPHYGSLAPVNSAVFWFVMQLAMLAGFATAYPVNWWLIARGIKEKM